MVYLSLQVGVDTAETKALWDNHALKTLRHNKKLTRKILKNTRWVDIHSPGGIIYDRRLMGLWDSEAHDMVIERMVRGLYYHHFNNEILGDKVRCSVQWLRKLDKDMSKEFEDWPQNIIGSGQLVYKGLRVREWVIFT